MKYLHWYCSNTIAEVGQQVDIKFWDKEWVRNVLERVTKIRRADQNMVSKWIKEQKQNIRIYAVKLTCPNSEERIRSPTMMQTLHICEFKEK